MKKFITGLFLILTSLTLLSGCKKTFWKTDLDAVLSETKKNNKSIMLLFTGNDWDGTSPELMKNYLNTKEFYNAYKDNYEFVNINFSQNEYSLDNSDSGEAAKKNNLVTKFYVGRYPSLYLLTSEGYVISYIPYSGTAQNLDEVKNIIGQSKEKENTIKDICSRLNSTQGYERLELIDELYNETDKTYIEFLKPLIMEVPEIDKENKSGLLGKYELQIAYFTANEKILQGKQNECTDVFINVCKNGHLSNALKQEAYFTAAYMLAATSSEDFDLIKEMLSKAIEMDPENEQVENIKATLDIVKKVAESYKADHEKEESGE